MTLVAERSRASFGWKALFVGVATTIMAMLLFFALNGGYEFWGEFPFLLYFSLPFWGIVGMAGWLFSKFVSRLPLILAFIVALIVWFLEDATDSQRLTVKAHLEANPLVVEVVDWYMKGR